MMSVEATYAGNDWTGSFKLEGASVVEATLMQAILPRLSLGMQLIHIPQPHAAITGISAVARLTSGVELVKAPTQQRVPRWVFALNTGTLTPLHASFTWHTPYKADFATELVLHPRQDGSFESVWCAGGIFSPFFFPFLFCFVCFLFCLFLYVYICFIFNAFGDDFISYLFVVVVIVIGYHPCIELELTSPSTLLVQQWKNQGESGLKCTCGSVY